MASSTLVELARYLSVMVRVHGPDPKGIKMKNHVFHHYSVGETTVSASGMLLPETLTKADAENREDHRFVVTVASVIEPFITLQHRDGQSQGPPELIPGAEINVMLEGNHISGEEGSDPFWLGARLVRLVDVEESSAAVRSIADASPGIIELGWSLASLENGGNSLMNRVPITRMAILSVSLPPKANSLYVKEESASVAVSSCYKRGEYIVAIGSPFGVLSPLHFFNSVSRGSIANFNNSLIIADVRCLPGMEGAPLFCEPSDLIGFLIKPLTQATTGAEIQLVIPWKALAASCDDLLSKETRTPKGSSLPIEKPISFVCLITMDGGVWASGVVISEQGLILTNAHLLEPWRFGRPKEEDYFRPSQGSRNIRVRLHIAESSIWVGAKVVYVSKGPLDVALLQLLSVPANITPLQAEFAAPATGAPAFVVGHGLFGPKSGLLPSVCSGVVAKVVYAKTPPYATSTCHAKIPAMIETTAAVHPGGSGGAVLNSDGRMIGLVTSNARHVGGTVIPHLNFSIPLGLLLPIFEFAKDMKNVSLLEKLDEANEELSSIWALVSPDPPKPPVRDSHALQKGTKFANFLADRDKLFSSNLLQVPNKSDKGNISSKL